MQKGKDYFERGNVLSLEQLPAEEKVVGNVAGRAGKVYKSSLFFHSGPDVIDFTDCTCPVGFDCKHTAALLLAYLQETAVDDSGNDTATTAQRSNWQQQFFPANETKSSFSRIAKAYHQHKDHSKQERSTDSSGSGASSKRRTTLVYVISCDSVSTTPRITLKNVLLRADGSFSSARDTHIDNLLSNNPPKCTTEKDREIAQLWQTIGQYDNPYYSSYRSDPSANPHLFSILLTQILKTGRCYFETLESPPLKLGPALPGCIVWEKDEHNLFRLAIVGIKDKAEISCLRWKIPWYVDNKTGECGPADIDLPKELFNAMFNMRAITADETIGVITLIHELGLASVIPLPPTNSKVEVRLIAPVPKLRIEHLTHKDFFVFDDGMLGRPGDITRVALFSTSFPNKPSNNISEENGTIVIEKQDSLAAGRYTQQLHDLGFIEDSNNSFNLDTNKEQCFLLQNDGQWLDFDSRHWDELRTQGWKIEFVGESEYVPALDDTSSKITFKLAEENNWWFSLALNIDIGGKSVSLLPILLSAIYKLTGTTEIAKDVEKLNHKGKFVSFLPDGKLIALPFERIRSILVSLQELLQRPNDASEPEELSVSALHIAQLLQDKHLAEAEWVGAKKLLNLVHSLKQLQTMEPVLPPANFAAELRPYQVEGLSWLQFMAKHEFGGILADDMGLGKTVQLLAHIALEKENKRLKKPYLVVCPTSVLPNWLAEAEKFTPHLKVVSHYGANRQRSAGELKKYDVLVTTYQTLLRDITQLKAIEWHGIALDEAQVIKNHATEISNATRSLKSGHRFCLTGTPIENHLGELWSQFEFLLPGLLSDKKTFKQLFRDPIERQGNQERRKALSTRVRPFLLRRTKQNVAIDLPPKETIIHKVALEGPQRDLYESVRLTMSDQVRAAIAKKGFKQSQIIVLDALLKLRQVCCDPRLVKLSAAGKVKASAKLDALMEMLVPMAEEGRKILLFSQFTSMLDLIIPKLTENDLLYVKLTGETKDRKLPVKLFQETDVPIFLISLKAGGTGLNLTAADTVIHYDPWWNPAVEEQATDRAHRIGQTKNIFVYKLIAQGTIEQRMLELQEKKRALANSIYDEQGNTSLAFSEADLDALLRPIDDL
jgi:SNF2 family DNA or RNA helicase